MDSTLLLVVMFGTALLLMVLGLPLAFGLGTVGMVFLLALMGTSGVVLPILTIWSWMKSFVLVALPLFIFMGAILEKSGIADEMLDMVYRWLGGLRGGLAVGVVFICVIFAAMSGSSGTATITLGILAIPPLLKRRYDTRLVLGSIMAGGALGFLIPPSVVFILYGMLAKASIGRLFAGGILPGLLLAALYCTYIVVRSFFQPELAPAVPREESSTLRQKFVALRAVVAPIVVVCSVLLTIFLGVVSPSEAAALGVASVLIIVAVKRRLSFTIMKESLYRTIRLCAMVMWIAYGALSFSAVYDLLGGVEVVRNLFGTINLSALGVLAVMQLSFFVAGCFLDDLGFLFMVMPIYLPIAKSLGFDSVWYGVLWCINSQMAFLTPPFGYNLFYMKAITGDLYRSRDIAKPVTMADIYRSVWPFVVLQAAGLALVIVFPPIALWLPNKIFGT